MFDKSLSRISLRRAGIILSLIGVAALTVVGGLCASVAMYADGSVRIDAWGSDITPRHK